MFKVYDTIVLEDSAKFTCTLWTTPCSDSLLPAYCYVAPMHTYSFIDYILVYGQSILYTHNLSTRLLHLINVDGRYAILPLYCDAVSMIFLQEKKNIYSILYGDYNLASASHPDLSTTIDRSCRHIHPGLSAACQVQYPDLNHTIAQSCLRFHRSQRECSQPTTPRNMRGARLHSFERNIERSIWNLRPKKGRSQECNWIDALSHAFIALDPPTTWTRLV